jgi:hypothetical protein
MKRLVNRILKFGSPTWILFLSTTGCFVFLRGYGRLQQEKKGRSGGV